MPGEWLVTKHGRTLGPYSHNDVCKFIRLGDIEPNDRLWRKGQKGRLPASTLFLSAFDVRTVAQLRSNNSQTNISGSSQAGAIFEQRNAGNPSVSTGRLSRMNDATFNRIENSTPSRSRFAKRVVAFLSVFILCGGITLLILDRDRGKTFETQAQDLIITNVKQTKPAPVVLSSSRESAQTLSASSDSPNIDPLANANPSNAEDDVEENTEDLGLDFTIENNPPQQETMANNAIAKRQNKRFRNKKHRRYKQVSRQKEPQRVQLSTLRETEHLHAKEDKIETDAPRAMAPDRNPFYSKMVEIKKP